MDIKEINKFIDTIPDNFIASQDRGIVICAGCRHFVSSAIIIQLLEKQDS